MKQLLLIFAILVYSQSTQAQEYITFEYTFESVPSITNVQDEIFELLTNNFAAEVGDIYSVINRSNGLQTTYTNYFWKPIDEDELVATEMENRLYELISLSNPYPISPPQLTNRWEYSVPKGYDFEMVAGSYHIDSRVPIEDLIKDQLELYNKDSVFIGRINTSIGSQSYSVYNVILDNIKVPYNYGLDSLSYGSKTPIIKGPAILNHEMVTRPPYYRIPISSNESLYFRNETNIVENVVVSYVQGPFGDILSSTTNKVYYSLNYTNTFSKVFTLTQTEQSIAQETLELLQAIASQTNNTQTTTITNTITNTVGYTLSKVADMRYGSKMIAVSNNTANLTFRIDAVSNLESNWNPIMDITVPFDMGSSDIGFFRVRGADELTTNEVGEAESPPNMEVAPAPEIYQEVMENLHDSFRNSTTTPDGGGFGENNATPI